MPIKNQIYYHYFNPRNGERPPVILLHGAGGSHLHWPAEIRRMPGYRVYALDLPGHGKSEGHSRQMIEEYAGLILAWMEACGIFRAVFVGHSMGGAIAQALAIDHPEHVLGLGLIGSGARLKVDPLILENAASDATLSSALDAIIKMAFGENADPRLVELAAMRMAGTRHTVLHGDLLACNQFDRRTSLGRIRVPTLVVVGQADRLTPTHFSQFLADQIPQSSLHILPQAGHMIMLEEPKRVAALLETFLNTINYHPGDRKSTWAEGGGAT